MICTSSMTHAAALVIRPSACGALLAHPFDSFLLKKDSLKPYFNFVPTPTWSKFVRWTHSNVWDRKPYPVFILSMKHASCGYRPCAPHSAFKIRLQGGEVTCRCKKFKESMEPPSVRATCWKLIQASGANTGAAGDHATQSNSSTIV